MITQPDHTADLGASVGSSNTGELTVTAEAILYSIEKDIKEVHIGSDSQWSINVITGKRPKTQHKLINYIRRLMDLPGRRIHLRWIRSHVGYEGHERADRLANEGRIMAEALEGRQHSSPVGRRRRDQTTPPVDNLPCAKTHQAFRDHFQNTQWASRLTAPLEHTDLNSEPLFPQDEDGSLFTLKEL